MNTTNGVDMRYTDAQRMELRTYVSLAGEVIAKVWPMTSVIARNPLQGLEDLSFEDAVQRGEQLFGGSGTLSSDAYREAFRSGRIQARHLEAVLKPLATDQQITFGGHVFSHRDVLRAVMVARGHATQLCGGDATAEPSSKEAEVMISNVTEWLCRTPSWEAREQTEPGAPCAVEEGSSEETMATWCDRTLGTDITDQINRQMIKWCAAFCDEGDAAWPMPRREETFFRAWKAAARYDLSLRCLGIKQVSSKILALADRPEDVVLESLEMLQVPHSTWQQYLSLHLAALPGWAGFIKWREEQDTHAWQLAYRIDLVKYLAVRLFYERELVATACHKSLRCEGSAVAVREYGRRFPYTLWFKRASVSGHLPKRIVSDAARLQPEGTPSDPSAWEQQCRRWFEEQRPGDRTGTAEARLLLTIAENLGVPAPLITSTQPHDLSVLLAWLRAFTPRQQRLTWLEAFERSHQDEVLQKLDAADDGDERALTPGRQSARPLAQVVFCIDVRSEVFRRHLEQRGGYETFGFAGFFGLPFSYRALDEQPELALCPVLLKPKHLIREVPRTYQDARAERRKQSTHLVKAGHELLHDLKHNVVTPYVMVEAIGWFFLLPFIGKTLCPRWYHRVSAWIKSMIMPAVATTLTVGKFSTAEAEDMLAAEQRLQIAWWLRKHGRRAGSRVTGAVLDEIRRQVLTDDEAVLSPPGALGRLLGLSSPEEAEALAMLRRECRLTYRGTRSRLDRITRTGFTLNEQAYYVETSLRLMGLTGSFARVVVLCGHGSTSENNPYESSLDCGACGGGQGLPNARAFAMMANRPQVREMLAARGLAISPDTHFVAALHNTTTDEVQVSDLEDVPSTHRKELAQILEDVHEAGVAASAERWVALTAATSGTESRAARQDIERRSFDWAQVRPEWGLARNSVFIVGDRRLTQSADLQGRSFLHSYDHLEDVDGRLLETIMTAPLIVAQWINMEYYFSAVAPDVYGSGSKIYHNVTGGIGVMTGSQSDLRMGLPTQTVMRGGDAYHEPMRLTAIIEAPRDRIMAIVARQPILEKLLNNRWVLLIAREPSEGQYYRYHGTSGWAAIVDIERPVGDAILPRA
ncbi:DUF2309 domain-containing protein [Nitrospira defluvii]|uniref:Probable inorganic carbon transporter subunit DabA n=1 Tax=Nitrospira defluvii TaxID=330214 RepID=A0ABN7L362_9BACT|nr:DUF2309 domain-containing protein [Nitrospira defluvii]CAE6728389.1 conserved hypothetical protein [Nitrospira defluvii]